MEHWAVLFRRNKGEGLQGGQSTLEYAILIAVVAAAFIGMSVYVQRSVQANLKVLEDRINAEQTE